MRRITAALALCIALVGTAAFAEGMWAGVKSEQQHSVNTVTGIGTAMHHRAKSVVTEYTVSIVTKNGDMRTHTATSSDGFSPFLSSIFDAIGAHRPGGGMRREIAAEMEASVDFVITRAQAAGASICVYYGTDLISKTGNFWQHVITRGDGC